MTTNKYRHECAAENAAKFLDWIANRGGVAVWESVDLSDPDMSWSSPALTPEGKPYLKPSWKAGNKPTKVITDLAEIKVYTAKEVQRFHVGVRMGDQGMKLKVTDGGTRRIHAALEKHGEGSFYRFDYEVQDAVIFVPDKEISLKEFAERGGL